MDELLLTRARKGDSAAFEELVSPWEEMLWKTAHAETDTDCLGDGVFLLKVMDIVLYENDEGEYILHRIWKIRGDELLLRTDNGLTPERVHRSQVLGVCKGYYRDASDEYTEIGSREDRRYLRQLHIRYMRKKIKHALQTIIRT